MTKFRLYFKNYMCILIKNMKNMKIIDILIYSLIININFFNLNRNLQILLSISIIRKLLIDYKYSEELHMTFFLAEGSIKDIALISFFFNNLFYICTSWILVICIELSFFIVLEGMLILNLLILISYLIKYFLSEPLIIFKAYSLNKLISSILYYISFSIFSIFLFHQWIGLIGVIFLFFFLNNKFNRLLNAYDLSGKYN